MRMLNQLINLLWTAASFSVVGFYWGQYLAEKGDPLIPEVIIAFSLVCSILPRRWLSVLTLSDNLRTYERMGVKFTLWFVQNGTLVKRIQQKFGKYRRVITSSKNALAYIGTINMQERYHYSCFVFFILSAMSAAVIGKIELAFLITICNVAYNVYPILLQQYNRLRIKLLFSKTDKPTMAESK